MKPASWIDSNCDQSDSLQSCYLQCSDKKQKKGRIYFAKGKQTSSITLEEREADCLL